MLSLLLTRPEYAIEFPIIAPAPTIHEGMLLKMSQQNGIGSLDVATAAGGEALAGFAYKYFQTPTVATNVEDIVVPTGGGAVTLQKTPLTPSTASSAVNLSTGSGLTYNAGIGSGQYSVTNSNVINFNTAQAGATIRVVYTYSLTAAEAQLLYGDNHYAGPTEASAIVNTCGVIKKGLVYTDQFDPAVNWFASAITDVAAGAGGIVTRGGSGSVIPCSVVAAPTPDYPFLGLSVNIA